MNKISLDYSKVKGFITEEEIKKRITELSDAISKDYEGKVPSLVVVLSGSFIFAADLVRELKVFVDINFIRASSYGESTVSCENVQINEVRGFDPKGKDIIIIEDIIDSGRTLSCVREKFLKDGAKSVELCTLLDKPSRRVVDIKAKYTGFEIEDKFVVGYGLDYAYKYRQYPFVGVLKPEYYE